MSKLLRFALFGILGSLLLAACATAWPGAPAAPGGGRWFGGNFSSNGERIFYTATNDRGERIRYTGGPGFGGMMGASLACASCHGVDGRGGRRAMHMQVIEAPDIRYQALTSEGEHEEAGGHDGAEGYDLETFRLAVVEGRHPNGERLSSVMPRWQLSDEDLADLLEFLKTLP